MKRPSPLHALSAHEPWEMESKCSFHASICGHCQPVASSVVEVGRRQADARLEVGSKPAGFLRRIERGGQEEARSTSR